MALPLGIVLGALAALPFVMAVWRGRPRMAVGLAAVLVSFALFHAGALLVRTASPDELVPAASVAVLTFLAAVLLGAWRREGR